MSSRWKLVALLCGAGACLAGVELKEDPPPVPPPQAGDIIGTVRPPEKVAHIEAISRLYQKTYPAKSFDKTSGRFIFAGLPGDADYDIRIATIDGRTLEGIDLSWVESRMLRMAEQRRKDLGLPPERDQPFTMDDARFLLRWVEQWQDFMEIKRVLFLKGHGKRATALVELMRTRDFYSAGGAYVWRVELWYFQNDFGGWDIVPNAERILYRKRCSPDEWGRVNLEFLPELSVYIAPDGTSKPLHFEIPSKGDLSRGRLPGTRPEVKTEPHILGLEAKAEDGATSGPPTGPGRTPAFEGAPPGNRP